MSKILFLVNHDVVIYNFLLELVERLLDDGHQVSIAAPYGERIDDLVSTGCKYYNIDVARHRVHPFIAQEKDMPHKGSNPSFVEWMLCARE